MVTKIVKGDADDFDKWTKKRMAEAASRLEELGIDPGTFLSTELGWLLCLPQYQERFLDFDLFQIRFLTAESRLRSILKARQVGFSFVIAAEALARCHLKDTHLAVCVSYNLDDAKEKVHRVKELHDELPLAFQKKMVIDQRTEVGFIAPGHKRRLSKVISYPSKAPRGKSGDVYLDELAHCQNDEEIYTGSMALIMKSKGQLSIGSTPLGRRGTFHAIHTQEFRRYPGFWRQRVPWWLHRAYCKDVDTAAALAPSLPTEVRVERWGTSELLTQFNNNLIEDFQQEFECAFQDERVSFFPYELIQPCACKERDAIPVYSSIESLARAQVGPLYLGFDVGRSKHPSELMLVEKVGDGFVLRYTESLRDMPFPMQRSRLIQIMEVLGDRARKFRIDSTGLGRNLAEDLQARFGRRVEAVQFTMQMKAELANNMKVLFEERNVELPKDRDLISQIHSIKQKITEAGNAIFDAEKAKKHHADKLWALALACYRPARSRKATHMAITAKVLGSEEKSLILPHGARRTPDGQTVGLVERLFSVPGEVAVPGIETSWRDLPLPVLEKRARSVAISVRVWKREGDEDKARQLTAEYKRLRRWIIDKRAGTLVPAGQVDGEAE